MSKKHLQRYIDEVAYRFNTRGEELHKIFADVVTRTTKGNNIETRNKVGGTGSLRKCKTDCSD